MTITIRMVILRFVQNYQGFIIMVYHVEKVFGPHFGLIMSSKIQVLVVEIFMMKLIFLSHLENNMLMQNQMLLVGMMNTQIATLTM